MYCLHKASMNISTLEILKLYFYFNYFKMKKKYHPCFWGSSRNLWIITMGQFWNISHFFQFVFFLHFFPLHPCLSLGFFLTDKLNFSYGPIFLKFWCIVIRNEIYKCVKLVKHLTWEFFHIAWNLPLYFEWRINWYSHCWNLLCKSNKSLFKRHYKCLYWHL